MATTHNITGAPTITIGSAETPQTRQALGTRGAPVSWLYKADLGAPVTLDADGLLTSATSTELPDTETVTYTTADDGSSPIDNAATPAPSTITTSTGTSASVWALDVPRIVTTLTTHGSSIVAMTLLVTGYDQYKIKMQELITVTATGTSKAINGAKAFMYLESYAITAAADAEANTFSIGWGDVLGLPYYLEEISDLLTVFSDADELTLGSNVIAGVTTTATSSTGDVRGTVALSTAADGSLEHRAWMRVSANTVAGLVGVDQYGG